MATAARGLLRILRMPPPSAPHTPDVAPRTLHEGEATLAGLRILVVDDDADTRQLESLIFTRAGAIVTEAASADVAFQAVCDFKPHLVVSDVDMPREDGHSLMRRIKALAAQWGACIPAIAVSGGSGWEARRAAFRAGFSAHFTKPVAARDLLAAAVALSVLGAR